MIEVLLSLGLVSVAILALMGLAITAVNARQKATDTEAARHVAQGQLARVVDGAVNDSPKGFRQNLFDHNSSAPFQGGKVTIGPTTFNYSVLAHPLTGTAAPNRLTQIEVEVWWWGDKDQERQGLGRLTLRTSQLLNEPSANTAKK